MRLWFRALLRGILTSVVIATPTGLALGAAPVQAAPAGSVQFDGYAAAGAVPSGLRVRIGVADDGGAPPLLRRLDVDLPAGFDLGPQAANRPGGLALCSATQFAAAAAPSAECPAASRVGSASMTAPSPDRVLTGAIYLGEPPAAGALPTLDVEVSIDGSAAPSAERRKLVGQLSGDDAGRLSVRFEQIPQIAFGELELTLDGGATALLVSPPACGASAGLVTLTAAADGSSGSAAAATTVGPDCASGQIVPVAGLASDERAAGAESAVRGTITVADRGPTPAGVSVELPPGLLAHIGAVPECSLAAAEAGQCGTDSRIGGIDVLAGAGPSPALLRGAIYVVPRAAGAVAGLAAVVDVRLGALDLGRLVLPGGLALRPTDAGLNLQFTLPSTFRGVGLHLRTISFALDRAGFTLNPSTCGPLSYAGSVSAASGTSAGFGGAVTYDGCASRPFAPTLSATLGGETGPLGHPNVTVGLNARVGDSNLRAAAVTLPRGIAADPANIQNACALEAFNASACSAAARVGTATARVALTPEPIPGDVYLVRIPGMALPGLGLSFTGRYTQRVLSTVQTTKDAEQRLVVRFDAIPDLPLRRLDLTIIGGAQGPIRVAGGTCTAGAVWDASFRGQGNQSSSHTIPAPCPPRAAKRAAIALSSKRGLSLRLTDLGGRALHSMKLTLPRGYSFDRRRAANKRFRTLSVTGGKGAVKTTQRTVQVFPDSKIATRLSLRLGTGTVRRAARLGSKPRTLTVDVRLAFTDGSVQRQKIRVRAS